MQADHSQTTAAAVKVLPKMEAPKPAGVAPANKKQPDQIRYPFWFGGSASSMASCVTHPLDLIKVRLQTRTGDMPKSISGTFSHILKHDGVRGLYSGLSASILRQLTYSTARFGIYEELKTRYAPGRKPDGTPAKPPSFLALVGMASAAGVVGGVAGNPADVINVRMQHDASLPRSQQRNYAHAIDGLVRMAREEGIASWFRGVGPNCMRAVAMTASQLATYDVFKRTLMRLTPMEDNIWTHLSASTLAGVSAAIITSPVDVIKTRVMSSQSSHSLPKLLGEIYAAEGFRWMFKGCVPSFLRLGPQTICIFVFLESHRKVYRKVNGLEA